MAKLDAFILKVDKMIIDPLIGLLFALAVVYFLYGVMQFLMNQDNDEKKTTGKDHMIWGIVGITIMLGVFTILNIVLDTFEIKGINPQKGTVELTPAP